MGSNPIEKETKYLETVMKNRPDSLLFARLADAYRKEGNIVQAIQICEQGLKNYPYYITARILLGRCYLEQQRYGEAIEAFSLVCIADRRNHTAIKMLADIFLEQGMQEKAGKLYAILLKMDPENPTIRQLCSRYPSSVNAGERDLFSVLGIESPAGEAFYQPAAAETPDITGEIPAGVTDFTEVEGISPEILQAEVPVVESMQENAEPIIDYSEQPEAVSGEDISDRMEMLFGEQTPQDVTTGYEEGSFPDEHLETIPDAGKEGEVVSGESDISGSDISNRIEELFSEQMGEDKETGQTAPLSDKTFYEQEQGGEISPPSPSTVQDFDFTDMAVETIQMNRSDIEITQESMESNIGIGASTGVETETGARGEEASADADITGTTEVEAGSSAEVGEVSGADISQRIEELFSDSASRPAEITAEAESTERSEAASPDYQIDISDSADVFSESPAIEPATSPADEIVSGKDVSDRLDDFFAAAPEAGIADKSREVVGGKEEAGLTALQSGEEMVPDEGGMILGDLQTPESAESLFTEEITTENTGAKEDEEAAFEPDFSSPEFAETMQFDHELFEKMLNPTEDETGGADHDASLTEDRPLTDVMLPEGAVSSEVSNLTDIFPADEIGNFEQASASTEMKDVTDHTPDQFDDLFGGVSEIKEEDLNFEMPPLADGEKPSFEVTTVQYENEGPDLVADAAEPAESGAVDGTAAFEIPEDFRMDEVSELFSDSSPVDGTKTDFELMEGNTNDLISEAEADHRIDDEHVQSGVADESPSGDEVAGRLERLFPSENIPGTKIDRQEPLEESAFEKENTAESLITEAPMEGGYGDEAALIETMQMHREELLEDEKTVKEDSFEIQTAGLSVTPPESPDEGVENRVDGSPVITGNDVSERLDHLFYAPDILSLSGGADAPGEDDQNEVMEEVSDFYTISGRDASRVVEEEIPENISEVEFETPSPITEDFSSEPAEEDLKEGIQLTDDRNQKTLSDASEILRKVEIYKEPSGGSEPIKGEEVEVQSLSDEDTSEPDERDKPFSIPEHVLTPTLADIYYQQGQHQLAIQIYRRLLEREPENERFINRIKEIQTAMEDGVTGSKPIARAVRKNPDSSGSNRHTNDEKKYDPRPLAGVHLSKQVRDAAKVARKKKF